MIQLSKVFCLILERSEKLIGKSFRRSFIFEFKKKKISSCNDSNGSSMINTEARSQKNLVVKTKRSEKTFMLFKEYYSEISLSFT